MSKDLYELLGLTPSASHADIVKAFRVLSLRWHPDMPHGDKDTYIEIKNAYNVLRNEKRRANYDRTGETVERPEGSEDADAYNFMTNLIQHALGNMTNVESDSLIVHMRKLLADQKRHCEMDRNPHQKQRDKLKKVIARLKAKPDKKNVISMLMGGQLAAIESKIAEYDKHLSIMKRVGEIIDDHEYDVSRPGESASDFYRSILSGPTL